MPYDPKMQYFLWRRKS